MNEKINEKNNMGKLITLTKDYDLEISKELFESIKLPVFLFWAYCYFLLEPQIKDKKYGRILQERMVGSSLSKYRKKKKLKALGVL
jgi:hypothetical protein